MDTRLVSRRALLTSIVGAGASVGVAQEIVKPIRPDGRQAEPQVLSGADIGFRVDHEDRDGARVGTLVVKVDGKWVDALFRAGIRRATQGQ
jgi:hypothetical protein